MARWNNSPRVDMLFHSDTLSKLRAIQFYFFFINIPCLSCEEAANINLLVFGYTRLVDEPKIIHTKCVQTCPSATETVHKKDTRDL